MDIKEAATAAAPHYPDANMPQDNAERVVDGARHLAPFLGQRMRAERFLNKSIVVRELLLSYFCCSGRLRRCKRAFHGHRNFH